MMECNPKCHCERRCSFLCHFSIRSWALFFSWTLSREKSSQYGNWCEKILGLKAKWETYWSDFKNSTPDQPLEATFTINLIWWVSLLLTSSLSFVGHTPNNFATRYASLHALWREKEMIVWDRLAPLIATVRRRLITTWDPLKSIVCKVRFRIG